MGLMDRAEAALIRRKKVAEGKTITYRRKAQTYTLTGWYGRGLSVNSIETGARVEISEREFFLTVADMAAAGLDEPQKGDSLKVSGETDTYEVLDPRNLGEPASRHSDNGKTFYRIHTIKVKVT